MRCPACGAGRLKLDSLEKGLSCHRCPACGGVWLRLQAYMRWRETGAVADCGAEAEQPEARDSPNALICPETGRIMLKYRFSKSVKHRVDLSRYAHAVWLDAGEWALLKREGFATKLTEIVTHTWQQRIRAAQAKDSLDAMYQEKFGSAAYGELKQMRQWLSEHGQRSDMMGFLLAKDPYSER